MLEEVDNLLRDEKKFRGNVQGQYGLKKVMGIDTVFSYDLIKIKITQLCHTDLRHC